MAETAVVSNTPFLWEGTDRNGKKVKGKSLANDEATVRADLRRQGVVPTRIRKQRQSMFAGGGKITTGDIAIFSRQLATATGEALSQRLGDEGFAFANVNTVPEINDEQRTVDVTFFVDPGRRVYCLLYTSPSPRDVEESRMPSSA